MHLSISVTIAAVMLSACAGGNNLNSAINNVRTNSMDTVASHARLMRLFLANGTEEQAITRAQAVVAATLKDPGSAQFRNMRLVDYLDGRVVCGEVNGKNSYGGYVGFTPFVASTYAADLYDKDGRYPAIQAASNAGLTAACGL